MEREKCRVGGGWGRKNGKGKGGRERERERERERPYSVMSILKHDSLLILETASHKRAVLISNVLSFTSVYSFSFFITLFLLNAVCVCACVYVIICLSDAYRTIRL